MRYKITYQGYHGRWHEDITYYADRHALKRHVENLRKKGCKNIITQEYYDYD